ncbi:hypothetical protein [Kitasatospora sp. NPDC098663]|uniref:hypothetical protein n=1 Tax=Kitasatospora sp. NPDC098663 TaxID=3364096 RepID=UPI0037F6A846
MTAWSKTTLVSVDRDEDREKASDGNSRFGVYLTQYHRSRFDPWEDGGTLSAAEFAAACWDIATPPIMAPGFAQRRPDLLGITARLTEEDRALFFDVAVPIHPTRDQMPDYRWRSWSTENDVFDDSGYRYHYEPEGDRPALLTTTVVRIPGADWALPAPVSAKDPLLVATAIDYVEAIARQLNEAAWPTIADLLARR